MRLQALGKVAEVNVLDLAKSNKRVKTALPTPDRDEQRVPEDLMDQDLFSEI